MLFLFHLFFVLCNIRRGLVPENARMWTCLCCVNKDAPAPTAPSSMGGWDDSAIVLGSDRGLPAPWIQIPLNRKRGSLTILDSRLIHAGGGAPDDGWLVKAFIAMGMEAYDYEMTSPVAIPNWGQAAPTCAMCPTKVGLKKCLLCHITTLNMGMTNNYVL